MVLPMPSFGQSFLVSNGDDDVDLSYMRGMMDLIQTYYVDEVESEALVEGAYQGLLNV